MIECVERDDVSPICPHCNLALTTVWCRRLRSGLGVRFIYICSHCQKVLGVSHRKGFWMG